MSGNDLFLPTLYIKAGNGQLLKFKCSFSVENAVREYTNQISLHFIMAGIENKWNNGIFVITHWKYSLILFFLTVSRYFAAATSF